MELEPGGYFVLPEPTRKMLERGGGEGLAIRVSISGMEQVNKDLVLHSKRTHAFKRYASYYR